MNKNKLRGLSKSNTYLYVCLKKFNKPLMFKVNYVFISSNFLNISSVTTAVWVNSMGTNKIFKLELNTIFAASGSM